MKSNRNVIIWSKEVFDLIDGRPIGGIAVQMFFWSKIFTEHGWNVYSLSECSHKTTARDNIIFKPIRSIRGINLLLEWCWSLVYLLSIRPNVVIFRGANRQLLPLALLSRPLNIKLVYFSASDVNFEPGKELVGSEINRKLYHYSLKHIRYFITQNTHQSETLRVNFGNNSLMLPNIWAENIAIDCSNVIHGDVVWIANFRRLKRAEWVLNLAKRMPEIKFVMAGGRLGSDSYYDEIEEKSRLISNVSFLGPQSFLQANSLVANSKVLLCTSTFEGFPNTFLQAWSNGIPVVSTVDPSGVIAKFNLGIVARTEEEILLALLRLMNDNEYYEQISRSVLDYFNTHHSAKLGYNKLIQYINE